MVFDPFALREDAKKEVYKLIDVHYKKLPKNSDGTINDMTEGFDDNDIDALRHAYVSGIFAMNYGAFIADFLGRLNEYSPG